jgi:hypothetical protein
MSTTMLEGTSATKLPRRPEPGSRNRLRMRVTAGMGLNA